MFLISLILGVEMPWKSLVGCGNTVKQFLFGVEIQWSNFYCVFKYKETTLIVCVNTMKQFLSCVLQGKNSYRVCKYNENTLTVYVDTVIHYLFGV